MSFVNKSGVDKTAIYGIIPCESVLSKTRGEHVAHSPFRGKTPQGVCLMLTQRQFRNQAHVSDRCGGCSGREVAKMPLVKIMERLTKFPWVSKFLPIGYILRFAVVRVEPEILDYEPERWNYGDDLNHAAFANEQLWLLNERGEMVTRQAVVTVPHRKFCFRLIRFERFKKRQKVYEFRGFVEAGSTVREIFEPLDAFGDQVHFILSCFQGTVILYTVPNGVPFAQWVRQGFKEKAKMVKRETVSQIPAPTLVKQADREEVAKASLVVEGDILSVQPPKRTPVFLDLGSDVLARMSPLARVVAQESRF